MSALTTLQEFCHGIGIRGPESLPAELSFERSGQVTVETDEDRVLISLRRAVPLYRDGVAQAALRAVSPAQGLPFPVRTGFLGEDTLVFLTFVTEDRLDLPTLDGIINLLTTLAERAEAGSAP